MSIIEEKAREIIDDSNGWNATPVSLDPATIYIISKIIISLVKLFIECRKSHQEAAKIIRSPGIFSRRKLWNYIKKINDTNINKSDIYESVLRIGSSIEDEEVDLMFKEVEKGES